MVKSEIKSQIVMIMMVTEHFFLVLHKQREETNMDYYDFPTRCVDASWCINASLELRKNRLVKRRRIYIRNAFCTYV